MRLDYAATTHVGRIRKVNEDSLLVLPDENVFVVADGMGGHGAGDVASSIAVKAIEDVFVNTAQRKGVATWPARIASGDDLHSVRLVGAIKSAHRGILKEIKARPKLMGMGTTVVACYFANGRLYIAHVGDSRCYCLRGEEFHLLTKDHSLVNDMLDRFSLGQDHERRLAFLSHVVSRALGVDDESNSEADISIVAPMPGDVYLMCSDGLNNEVNDVELAKLLATEKDPRSACRELVKGALEHGGRDNITAVVVRFMGGGIDSQQMVLSEETFDLTEEWDSKDDFFV